MSVSCLSAAAAAAAAAAAVLPSSSSSVVYSRLFCFHSQIQLHSSSYSPKPFKLRIQNPNCLLFIPALHHRRRPCFSADGFEASGDQEQELESEVPTGAEEEEDDDDHDDDEEEKPTQASGDEGRLYVGNLPYSMTSFELNQIFGEAGNVVDVQIVYDRVTDRSRGFAFVTMASNEEAKEAIRMFDGSQIGGRSVKVNFPEVPRGGEREVMRARIQESNRNYVDSPYKIYAGNLGWGLTSQGLREAFADQPGLLGAKVIYDRNTGRSRGFGFITFDSAANVQSAMDAMNGVEVLGRPLRLSLAAEKMAMSSSPASERDTDETLDNGELLSSVST